MSRDLRLSFTASARGILDHRGIRLPAVTLLAQ